MSINSQKHYQLFKEIRDKADKTIEDNIIMKYKEQDTAKDWPLKWEYLKEIATNGILVNNKEKEEENMSDFGNYPNSGGCSIGTGSYGQFTDKGNATDYCESESNSTTPDPYTPIDMIVVKTIKDLPKTWNIYVILDPNNCRVLYTYDYLTWKYAVKELIELLPSTNIVAFKIHRFANIKRKCSVK